jgi:hypothetical protein
VTTNPQKCRLLVGVLAWPYVGIGGRPHKENLARPRQLTTGEELVRTVDCHKSSVVRAADGTQWAVPTEFLAFEE